MVGLGRHRAGHRPAEAQYQRNGGRAVSGRTAGRRDAAFTLFYMAINIGATLGPLVTAWLAQRYGWHVGFLAAAVGMACGLVYLLAHALAPGRCRLAPPGGGSEGRAGATGCSCGSPSRCSSRGCIAAVDRRHACSPVALQGGAMLRDGGPGGSVLRLPAVLRRTHRGRERVASSCCWCWCWPAPLFWAGYEQAGSSLKLFAERNTDRMIGGFEIPGGLVPVGAGAIRDRCARRCWPGCGSHLAARGRDLSVIIKFALGLVGMALGFLVMVGAARSGRADGRQRRRRARCGWCSTYLLHTIGELALSPVGMSATTRLAPKRFAGQAMGMWFTSLAHGQPAGQPPGGRA